ncbi:hypothetical protein [Clostridium septicum]|uniref:Uncharacterized protein n=1 Tax=Clostridium septicum TaxID=1504 RepID=A0A9N7JMV1_CLOSE|nr:hypothetical protein [Clostridium septicum]AYE35328.1 hypothetical protein CP523_13325 [Clostridium septicum]UEC20016.1 hypothetical protein LK444_11450 [Clostridium septicum]USS01927.1 hypothetical protein NH397_05720 [Clostridium septicum]
MSNKLSVCHKRVKYTSYELVREVKKIVDKYNNVEECAKHYKVSEELIKNILKNSRILTFEMYKVISLMLNKSIKELTEIENVSLIPQFRGLKEEEQVEDLIEFANNIFEEIIINSKLRG